MLQAAQVVIDRSRLGAVLAVVVFQSRQRPAVTFLRLVEPSGEFAPHSQVVQRARRFEAFGAESPDGEIQRAADYRLGLSVTTTHPENAPEIVERLQPQTRHVFIVFIV